MKLHQKQKEIASSTARFKVIRAGRKGGKTTVEIETLAFKATASAKRLRLRKTEFATGRKVIYIAPTQIQARTIVWQALKNRLYHIAKFNEQRMEMIVPNEDGNDTTIYVGGWENRENYRGFTDVAHITFDETDTLKDFFIGWSEIFRPMFLDTGGTADFIGTPKKENPNLRRLEKEFEGRLDTASFHFTSHDNPHLSREELKAIEEEYKYDRNTYKQEILAEYVEDEGALFRYASLLDMFTNTVEKRDCRYMTVDIADDGTDKTIFAMWHDMELYRIERYQHLNTESIINHIREYAAQDRIPYSHIAVDAIGVGAGVASSSLLAGIVGFKSSYGAIRTDESIVQLPNIHYRANAPLTTEYKNLRSQCLFNLSRLVNNHEIAVSVSDVQIRDLIIEELSHYQDASKGDGKRMPTPKEDIKEMIGRSPDLSDTLIMRMYFTIRENLQPFDSEEDAVARDRLRNSFDTAFTRQNLNEAM